MSLNAYELSAAHSFAILNFALEDNTLPLTRGRLAVVIGEFVNHSSSK